MDNEKFGKFIAMLRKEKGWTQLELAEKLNVTDKAVSKWERGKGFPDISTLKPLADVLEVSLLEIMQTEKLQKKAEVSTEKAQEALKNTISIVEYQRTLERKNIIIGIVSVLACISLIFLVDVLHWETFIFVCLPFIFFTIGILLLVMSVIKKRHRRPCFVTMLFGILAILFPVLICLLLFFAFAFGGPVPN